MRAVHLIVPFAAPLSDAGRAALSRLELPRLRELLARLPVRVRDDGDETSFSPPHERALARELGFAGGDGQLPWAAWHAAGDGVSAEILGDLAWGELTPAHWQLGTEQVSFLDPLQLELDAAGSHAFFEAVAPLFTSEGFVLRWGAPLRWYLAHESLAELRTASPDRVIGRHVDAWLTEQPAVRLVRRLQNEVQMLLYTHPLNDEREARGLASVNTFWLSGCGPAQAVRGRMPQVDERLRTPALNEDWEAWSREWAALDAGPVAELLAARVRGQTVRLTLCGERAGVSCEAGGAWQALRARLARPAPQALLETL
ncbi:hypothetical protein CKO44_21635 [Rubrivivax gelatinosus]|uniref:Phosphoglycerate mutase n=1 Tax=Rubrivivax gelatinosus TaxID=28068 RepID=A0ABS1DUM4_RUBGE|nr:hypothetical protein [Rubrivivax gelatinosus]MBK1616060.1 hypothetical protein [Rubrivivax gelatinosus]MBK1713320.1 hypothetical protein [Rubrivivax gelatinosus]